MLIRMCDVFYVETQFNHSKLCNFISPWEMVKPTVKLGKRSSFHKVTGICKENQEGNVLYIRGYGATNTGFKTL